MEKKLGADSFVIISLFPPEVYKKKINQKRILYSSVNILNTLI